MGRMPAAAAFSYGQRKHCADLSELLRHLPMKIASRWGRRLLPLRFRTASASIAQTYLNCYQNSIRNGKKYKKTLAILTVIGYNTE